MTPEGKPEEDARKESISSEKKKKRQHMDWFLEMVGRLCQPFGDYEK